MAITVVGKDEKHIKECSCKNCSSKLQYTLADTQTGISSDYGGGSDHYRFFCCPVCNERIYVKYY